MRLFISIPLSKKSSKSVEKIMKTLRPKIMSQKGVNFVPKAKWNLTLLFLGDQNKKNVESISEAIKTSIVGFKSPDIHLDKIKYFPAKKPRMLWLTTNRATSNYLESIKNQIGKNLKEEGIKWKEDKKKYRGHVTLAKFNPVSIKKLPEVETEADITFRAQSVDLIHSIPKKDGNDYDVLFSMDYK